MKGDVERAEQLDLGPLGDEPPQARCERHAARLDADERESLEPSQVVVMPSHAAPSMISWAMRASDFEIASASSRRDAVAPSGRASSPGSFPASLDRERVAGSVALSDRANHTGTRLGRWHAVVGVGAIVLLSALARFLVARSFDVPWIAPDEMIYGLVGQSLWETGTLAIRESTVPYYSLPTPALVGLPLTAGDLASGVAVAQALQALAMSLVAVPGLWASRLAGARWALAAAVLAVLPPALWYGGLLMTEALFYPLVVAAHSRARPHARTSDAGAAGAVLAVGEHRRPVRLQALILLPALLFSVGLYAWFARSRAVAAGADPAPGRSCDCGAWPPTSRAK